MKFPWITNLDHGKKNLKRQTFHKIFDPFPTKDQASIHGSRITRAATSMMCAHMLHLLWKKSIKDLPLKYSWISLKQDDIGMDPSLKNKIWKQIHCGETLTDNKKKKKWLSRPVWTSTSDVTEVAFYQVYIPGHMHTTFKHTYKYTNTCTHTETCTLAGGHTHDINPRGTKHATP